VSNTCAVEQGKKTDCDFRDGDTSDHVCTCVPPDAVDPAAGVGLLLHSGAVASVSDSRVIGSGDSNLVLWNGSMVAANSAFLTAAKEGVRLAAGSTASLDKVEIGFNGGVGLSLASGSSAHVRECAVRRNLAHGALVDKGSAMFSHLTDFEDNMMIGINVLRGSRVDLTGGSISGNTATGIMVQSGSQVTAVNCSIARNSGSGMMVQGGSAVELLGCFLLANNASQLAPSQGGGAMVFGNSSLTASGTVFTGNHAGKDGGGLFFDGHSGGRLQLHECQITENTARAFGGGVRAINTVPLVETMYATGRGKLDSYLLPTNNRTHLFLVTSDYCLRALPINGTLRPLADLPVIVGTSEQSGFRDGRQDDPNPSSRPQLQSYQMRGSISPTGQILYMTAVMTNILAIYSPIRIVDLNARAVTTLSAFDKELNKTLASQGRSVSCIQPDRTGSLLYICHRAAIRVVDLASGYISTVAGRVDAYGWSDGIGPAARFAGPEQVALYAGNDSDGAADLMFMIDYLSRGPTFAVRALDLGSLEVRTLVSDRGKMPNSILIDGPAGTATLGDIWSIAVAQDGTKVYLMSYTYSCVRAVSTVTGFTSTYVAKCSSTSTGDQVGSALDARMSIPDMLTLAGEMLFLYDQGNRKIKVADAPDPIQMVETTFSDNKAAYGAGASLIQACSPNHIQNAFGTVFTRFNRIVSALWLSSKNSILSSIVFNATVTNSMDIDYCFLW
jgi:hypothetical protein